MSNTTVFLVRRAVDHLAPFVHKHIRGTLAHGPERADIVTYGKLLDQHRDMFRQAVDEGEVFVIYSFDTPIAWHPMNGRTWIMPDVVYTPTTSAHQGLVADALDKSPRDVRVV